MQYQDSQSGVHWWDDYWGELAHDGDKRFPSILYGFNADSRKGGLDATIPAVGCCFGFIASGSALVRNGDSHVAREVEALTYFSTANGAHLTLSQNARVVVMQAQDFVGLTVTGAEIEPYGRLKYIDSCSDTLLIGPPTHGDPCLNHLHFPQGVVQTEHSHPSTRYGIVARGQGRCRTNSGHIGLSIGRIFYIERGASHSFSTEESASMDIIAYHPDTDFGPTHEDHPMINRTWIDGEKIDNRAHEHAAAAIVLGRQKA